MNSKLIILAALTITISTVLGCAKSQPQSKVVPDTPISESADLAITPLAPTTVPNAPKGRSDDSLNDAKDPTTEPVPSPSNSESEDARLNEGATTAAATTTVAATPTLTVSEKETAESTPVPDNSDSPTPPGEPSADEDTVEVKSISSVSDFTTPTTYESFGGDLESAFALAVEKEFSAASEKAGISVAVYSDDKLWTYASGVADSTYEMTVNTPLLIGSTSKTLVSAIVLIQIEQRLYGIDSSLESVLSGHPDYQSFDNEKINPAVTIEELLTMRSGLPNFNDNRQGISGLFTESSWTPSDNILLNQSPYVEPGDFDYNDTNLALLGLVAEYHGGNDLNSLYKEVFFNPFGIAAIPLSTDITTLNPAMPYDDVSAWSDGFGNVIEAAPFSFEHWIRGQSRMRWACCWMVSTPANLARWGYELYSTNGTAISQSARNNLLNSLEGESVIFQGTRQQYGYFVTKRTFNLPASTTITTYGHPGGGGGYSTLLRYSPELDLSIAIIANSPLKFQGACRDYDPRTCIAESIFATYSNSEN